mmetsp:Transcript_2552/g.4215  ORF Transcript_2552/g.4215 Transcript_2552/m.4215 type:complete len:838 (+) Transcript_2552:29-2542(+)
MRLGGAVAATATAVACAPLAVAGAVVVNEVAYAGSPGVCDGSDWIELLNAGATALDLANYTLHDDKGPGDENAKVFGEGEVILEAGDFVVLCKGVHFEFGVGGGDAVTVLDAEQNLVSTSEAMPGTGSNLQTFARFENGYTYTSSPTPGAKNVLTQDATNVTEALALQNGLGQDFFRLNDDGTPRLNSLFEEVVDLYISLKADDLTYLEEDPGQEEYVPVQQFKVVHGENNETVLSSGGRMRTKGQSTLMIPACIGVRNTPFRVDFNSVNQTQTLFGIEKAYLRNHLSDQSYMREYAAHRLNARFGLPHLRTRAVRLFLNEKYTGFYTLMEAPEQAYVMQRSFGPFDPAETALFKFKTLYASCGQYSEEEISAASERDTPDPYYFERGEHRDKIPVLGVDRLGECVQFFYGQIMKDRADVIKGWLEHDKNCSKAMVGLGIVDRDFGPKNLETSMISLLEAISGSTEELIKKVDVDQWLKNFASYAVLLNFDSPINNLNNWYVGTTSSGANDWQIFQYDHNNIATRSGAQLCASSCASRQIYWPILRPGCRSSQAHTLLGPFLGDSDNLSKYLEYVREFTELLSDDFFQELQNHGVAIKSYVVLDPLSDKPNAEDAYENAELSEDYESFNTVNTPFLKIIKARKFQVLEQLDGIATNSLPREGEYGLDETCPDWRDPNGENYLSSGVYVGPSDICPADCATASSCFDHDVGVCEADGKNLYPDCAEAMRYCRGCFPHSRCGALESKNTFSSNKECKESAGEGTEACQDLAAPCFSHTNGECAFNGELLTVECKLAEPCKPCYPESRCGKSVTSPAAKNCSSITQVFVLACVIASLFMS